MNDQATVLPLDDQAEHEALAIAAAEAHADLRPDVPYEPLHADMPCEVERSWRRIAATPKAVRVE